MLSYFKQSSRENSISVNRSKKLSRKISPRIRLKIVNQFFPPDYAPTGQLIAELAHQLKDELGPIEIFASQPSYAFDSDDSPTWEHYDNTLTIRRSQSTRLWPSRIRGKVFCGVIFFVRAAINLLKHTQRRELVLLTTAPPFLPFLGYLLSKVCNIRYICLLYDLYPDIAVNLQLLSQGHWITKLWDTCNFLAWNRSAAIIVLSDAMKTRIAKKHPALEDKIFVLPTWADPHYIKSIPKHNNWFAQQHGLVKPFTVLYSGNMGRCHDIQTLLDAIVLLRDRPFQFVFIGSGAKFDVVSKQVKSLKLENCLFLPYQSREVLPFSLTACDVSIVSIRGDMEGLVVPSKLYSSLATGRPVVGICESHSYLNALVNRAQCGATFLNGDSKGLAQYLEKLSQDPEWAAELGQSGRDYCISNFTVEKISKDYLQLFQSFQK
jgi:glycosyltransferase involved in cell wall biosynthesis